MSRAALAARVVFFCTMTCTAVASAQPSALTVRVLFDAAPVPNVAVHEGNVGDVTDAHGVARLSLNAGPHRVTVERLGFETETLDLVMRAGVDTTVTVSMREKVLENEVVVVSAARRGAILSDQPQRIEALPTEEIQENLTVAPGNVSTLLTELAGVRVQTVAPALGGAVMRLRGLPGRLTLLLVDNLPLTGARSDAFDLVQMPPLDLERVEVIKGVASSVYGGSAVGGVVNLVSRRPDAEPALLFNRSSNGATDVSAFAAGRLSRNMGGTVTVAGSGQARRDVDGDGWADVPWYRRGEVRPRLFWKGGPGRSLMVTAALTRERRKGGVMPGRHLAGPGTLLETLDTQRIDGGATLHYLLHGNLLVGGRAAAVSQRHDRAMDDLFEQDEESSAFAEASLSGTAGANVWTGGTALQLQRFRVDGKRSSVDSYATSSIFVEDKLTVRHDLIVAGSGRLDLNSAYGTFFSPRLSVLLKPVPALTLRATAGGGYAPPTSMTDEAEATRQTPAYGSNGLEAERAEGASFDAGWTHGALEVEGSLFGTVIRHPLGIVADDSGLLLVNRSGATRIGGAEALIHFAREPLQAIGSYTFLDARQVDRLGGREEVALTPRHRAAVDGIIEDEERGRVGAEVAYVGRQHLAFDPYRTFSRPYVEMNVLAALYLGETTIFLNAIDLFDVRQTRFDPLIRPSQGLDGRWTTDVWAPLAGRVINAGVRIAF